MYKKTTLLVIAAFIALSMGSCKKDRTCTCTSTSSGYSLTATIVVKKATKKAAKQGVCADQTITSTNNGGQTSTTVMTCIIQ